MKKLVAFFVFSSIVLAVNAQSWQMSEYYLGMGVMSASKYGDDINLMREYFPNAKHINTDFSDYTFSSDSYTYGVRSPNFELNFGIGLAWIKPDHRFSGRLFLRPHGGVSNFDLLYDNKEKVKEIAVDSIERKYYSFWWEERYKFLGTDFIITSRLKGRKQRWRFWAGGLLTLGAGSGKFNSFYSYGRIKFKEKELIDGSYVYTFNPNAGYYISEEAKYNVNTHAVIRIGIPLGLEFAMGKQRQFRYGVELRMGSAIVAGGGYNFSTAFSNMFGVFRWVIQPFGADKIPEGFNVDQ